MAVSEVRQPHEEEAKLRELVAQQQAELAEREKVIAALRELAQSLEGKNGALEGALINHATEIEILKRKLFGTKSERLGTNELQLLLGELLGGVGALQRVHDDAGDPKPDSETKDDEKKPRSPPKGRRDLSQSKLPKVIVELTDPLLAAKGRLIGHDTVRELMYVRGGFRVLVKQIAKYEIPGKDGPTVLSTEPPKGSSRARYVTLPSMRGSPSKSLRSAFLSIGSRSTSPPKPSRSIGERRAATWRTSAARSERRLFAQCSTTRA